MQIDSSIDQKFIDEYRGRLIEKTAGSSIDVFHNFRGWDYSQIFKHMSMYDSFLEGSILDTGAMHTYFCLYLADFVSEVVASDSFYWAARPYCQEKNLMTPEEWMGFVTKYDDKIQAKIIDLERIPPDYYSKFDYVFCVSTIEHVINDLQAMLEIGKALKVGGRAYITSEFCHHMTKAYSETDGSFYRVYDEGAIKFLIEYSGMQLVGDIVVSDTRDNVNFINVLFCLEKL